MSPKPHSNLNLTARRTYAGRYTTIGFEINVTSDGDLSSGSKIDAPGLAANPPLLIRASSKIAEAVTAAWQTLENALE